MSRNLDISVYDSTSDLYKMLDKTGAIGQFKMFSDSDIPEDNTGYVLTVDGEIAAVASVYDECCGGYLNEVFEVSPKFRGQGLCKTLYEFIKKDLDADYIHGFATSDDTQKLWEHLGQVCIDPETREMVELINCTMSDFIDLNTPGND